MSFDLATHLCRQREFSRKTFGPGPRLNGVIDHIRKEIAEIRACDGVDVYEWADLVILLRDGSLRQGNNPEVIARKEQEHRDIFERFKGRSINDRADQEIEDNLVYLALTPHCDFFAYCVACAYWGAKEKGFSKDDLDAAIVAKQDKNEARTWPDWRTADPNKAIEHVRNEEV